jgi:plasmid stabilization system protein ParE
MALEIYWSKNAEKSFDSIITYLESNWREQIVSLFVKKVFEFIEIISEYPKLGQ